MYVLLIVLVLSLVLSFLNLIYIHTYKNEMEVVITKSTKEVENTMPELMVLKLLALARRVLQTSPTIKNTYRKYRYIGRHKNNEDCMKTRCEN